MSDPNTQSQPQQEQASAPASSGHTHRHPHSSLPAQPPGPSTGKSADGAVGEEQKIELVPRLRSRGTVSQDSDSDAAPDSARSTSSRSSRSGVHDPYSMAADTLARVRSSSATHSATHTPVTSPDLRQMHVPLLEVVRVQSPSGRGESPMRVVNDEDLPLPLGHVETISNSSQTFDLASGPQYSRAHGHSGGERTLPTVGAPGAAERRHSANSDNSSGDSDVRVHTLFADPRGTFSPILRTAQQTHPVPQEHLVKPVNASALMQMESPVTADPAPFAVTQAMNVQDESVPPPPYSECGAAQNVSAPTSSTPPPFVSQHAFSCSAPTVTVEQLADLLQASGNEPVRCPSGFAFSVYDSEIAQHYVVESEAIQLTQGAIRYVEYYGKFGAQTRFRFQLCKKFLENRCPQGNACSYIHCVSLPNSTQVHINEGNGHDINQNKIGYQTLPPGFVITVYAPNDLDHAPQGIPSEMILSTQGAVACYHALKMQKELEEAKQHNGAKEAGAVSIDEQVPSPGRECADFGCIHPTKTPLCPLPVQAHVQPRRPVQLHPLADTLQKRWERGNELRARPSSLYTTTSPGPGSISPAAPST